MDPGTNILYGDNAQGKTNILEAIYLCATTRSYRGTKDRDIIRFGQNEGHIRMLVEKDGISHKIDMHLRGNQSKGIAIDGQPIRKARDLLGTANVVFFSPEDLNIIKNGPSERRRFLDAQLCQMDKLYLSDLTEYTRVVNQRNKLLKDISFKKSLLPTLDIWDVQLVRYGKSLIEKRSLFLEELQPLVAELHSTMSNGRESASIIYEPNVSSSQIEEQVFLARERDLSQRMTSVGPHRDDLRVMANDIDLRKYGSQGQQRTAALSLKLSELHMMKKKNKDNPILLLDDVLSELDTGRQNCLLDSLYDIQTLMTCTGLEDFVNHRFALNKIFQVVEGHVFERKG